MALPAKWFNVDKYFVIMYIAIVKVISWQIGVVLGLQAFSRDLAPVPFTAACYRDILQKTFPLAWR